MDTALGIYGLESQGRALCSHSTDAEKIRFFAATLSPRSNARVHQLDFDEETNRIIRKVYNPGIGEVWQMQFSFTSNDLLGLCYNQINDKSAHLKASVWKVPIQDTENLVNEMKLLCELEDDKHLNEDEDFKCLDWHPSREGILATVSDNHLLIWDVADGKGNIKESYDFETVNFPTGKWSPHLEGNQFGLVSKTGVIALDVRTMKQAWEIKGAHKYFVRDIDFNPNKQFYLASCGDDCWTRFWDYRNSSKPVKEIKAHSHWVWRVKFNSFHDQLVLTSGSDSRVVLHSLPSISSEPKGHAVFSDTEEEAEPSNCSGLEEGVVFRYEVHEDAVYAVEWSNYDAWTFASLSYDGRVVINRVPQSYKYKIIL